MSWSGKRVLVTGAGGFIGSHLVERLIAEGATVRAFVHYNALGSAGWLDGSPARSAAKVTTGDINDRESVRAAMDGADIVFHLAALIAIPYSYRAPASYLRVNVEGTLNVLQTARDVGVGRLVHTSTSEVYGTAQYVPIDEGHPLQGQSPYAASKIAADKFVEAFHLSFGVPAVTVRPFNTFGPRQSPRAVVPAIITQCLSDGVVRLGNLHPTRDFNYVSNTVDGFLRAGATPGIEGRTVNLGSGREIAIGELARLIAVLAHRPVTIEHDPERGRPASSEVNRLNADNRAAQTLLGWKPSVTLEQGLAKTIAWVREQRFAHTEAYAI